MAAKPFCSSDTGCYVANDFFTQFLIKSAMIHYNTKGADGSLAVKEVAL